MKKLLLLLSLAATAGLFAQDKSAEAAAPASREEQLKQAGIKLTAGPAKVALGKVAELNLPAGFHFIGPDSLDKFYEMTQNSRSGNEVGVVMASKDWMLFFDYDDIGYVKDDEKDKLEADKLMKSLSEGQEAANEARKERGWDQMRLAGWATAPHYDQKTNNLKWAINLSSSGDNYKDVWINESIRLLGRGGVMNVTLVCDTAAFKIAEADAEKLLAGGFGYVSGEKYAEFKSGDKIAQYGLAALVLGGGAAVAAKTGLFAVFFKFLGKAWKLVVVAVIALGAGVAKLWNRVTGARPADESGNPPSA